MQGKSIDTTRSPATEEEVALTKAYPWLRPQRASLTATAEVEQGLGYLQLLAAEDDVALSRALVQFSFWLRPESPPILRRAPSISVINRRRRAARLWINAILAGDLTRDTLRALTHTWLPQLAGTGPEPRKAAVMGRRMVEFLRGAITASVMEWPDANLLRHAKALHALDAVLAGHLLAIRAVVATAAPLRV
jgi:hypothetical protein